MTSDDRSDDGPSIAPPSIGFGLRRRRKPDPAPDPAPEVEQPPPVVEQPAPVVEQQGPPGPSVVETPAPDRRPEPEPLVRVTSAQPTTIFDVVTGAAPAPAPVVPQPQPRPVIEPEPVVVPEPEPEPEPDDATAIIPGLVEEPTQGVPVVEVPTRPAAPPLPAAPVRPVAPPPPAAAPPAATQPRPTEPAKTAKPVRPPREKRELTTPSWLVGRVAAVVVGAVVGLVVVGSTALALQGCQAVQGTTSCGTGPGFFLLVVILLLAVVAGAALLRLTGVADGTAISVLGVVLMVVIALLFLLGSIFDWWMVIAIPLICAATFATAHWTTVAFADVDP